ncbi:MAG: glutamine--fructose-6-phosphate transaminase (isomerizing) [Candidatus Tritonobacter lacicola]|nr:glutamine--fructose-6-phosphate transaminase (isomerizing) [Candidatus Tritonobacter lacicola]
MCGIIGYVGDKEAVPILMDGLKRLEYRGYDSAGIVVIDACGEVRMMKREGKLKVLEDGLAEHGLRGTLGLGHTRWATHGSPSEVNAHPHFSSDGEIAVVHNGIIENFLELRAELEGKGHTFASETDTEVIVRLVEEALKGGAPDLEAAVRASLRKLKGQYAVGLLRRKEPDKIVAARLDSPLIVGLGDGENYIASDVPAILNRTRKVIYLENEEIAVVTADGCRVTDIEGNETVREVKEITWDIDAAEKGGYEKFMLKEIHEQPQAVSKTIMGRISTDGKEILMGDLNVTPEEIRGLRKIFIISCGTAFYASNIGRYLLEHYTNIAVEVDFSSEFRYRNPKLSKQTLVMTVTQSGETADTIASLRMAKEKGCKVISVVNVVGSTIDRESDGVIYTRAGPEIGVASTKAYTAQLAALFLFTLWVGRMRGEIDDGRFRELVDELQRIPAKVERVLEKERHIRSVAEKYYRATNAFFLGRGFNFPNAMEGALKLKEISYMHAEGYAAGEMKHGPIALIDEHFPVVCICTGANKYDKMLSNIKEVQARKGRIIAIATEGDDRVKDIADDVIYVPETVEPLSPLINVVPLQLFAYYIALERGCDIDKPRNLAKSVTVE